MKTQELTTTIGIRDNACETRKSPSFGGIPVCGWDWSDEARLADFAEQDVRVEQDAQAEKDDQAEQATSPLEDNPQYAALYFIA